MKTYAQLVDKTVINTIIADEDFINESNNVYVEYTNENIAYIVECLVLPKLKTRLLDL